MLSQFNAPVAVGFTTDTIVNIGQARINRPGDVFLSITLAIAGFHFARRLWGVPSALPVLVLFLFEPNLMAHGRYATTDMGGVLFTFLATFMLWRLWRKPGRWPLVPWLAASLFMGLAFGSKLSALGFILILRLCGRLPPWCLCTRGFATPHAICTIPDVD